MIITETVYFDNLDILKNKKKQFSYLKKKYENTCYKKLYIKKFNKIIKKSKNIIDNNDFNLYYKSNITFDVDTLEIKKNDELNIKITDKHPKLGLISKNDYMFVYVLNSIHMIDKIKIDDIKKIKVEGVKYNKNTNKIVIISKLLD